MGVGLVQDRTYQHHLEIARDASMSCGFFVSVACCWFILSIFVYLGAYEVMSVG